MHRCKPPSRRDGPALLAALSVFAVACGSEKTTTPTTTAPPAGKPAHIQVTTAVDMALPGGSLDTVVAVVTDESDKPLAAAGVTWSVETGAGSVRAVSDRAESRGMAGAIWTLGPKPGRQRSGGIHGGPDSSADRGWQCGLRGHSHCDGVERMPARSLDRAQRTAGERIERRS